ncbi:MAG: biotin--[acetyl-CoA-carboxylase] ligase, partial [Candidatus Binatia bacterium]
RSCGYRLVYCPDALIEEEIRPLLRPRGLYTRLVCFARTASTNKDAFECGRRGEAEGLVVIADEQSAGRGRLGRQWESVPGVNLYLSVLLRPDIPPAHAPQLSLVAAVAVASALSEIGLEPAIKWPNDVLLGGRKVCGVLTEIEAETDRVGFVVVGIGVNLNSEAEHFSEDLRDTATSVLIHSGRSVDRVAFVASLLGHLERLYATYTHEGFSAIAPQWEARSSLRGRAVTVVVAGRRLRGQCVGIDTDGALLVKEDSAGRSVPPTRVLAGDVTLPGGYCQ